MYSGRDIPIRNLPDLLFVFDTRMSIGVSLFLDRRMISGRAMCIPPKRFWAKKASMRTIANSKEKAEIETKMVDGNIVEREAKGKNTIAVQKRSLE